MAADDKPADDEDLATVDDDEDDDEDAGEDDDEDDDEDDEDGETTVEDVCDMVTDAFNDALEGCSIAMAEKKKVLFDLEDGTKWVCTVKRRH